MKFLFWAFVASVLSVLLLLLWSIIRSGDDD